MYQISGADEMKLRAAFVYHPPQEGQGQRYEKLRAEARNLALTMTTLCPPSRELSLALTNLEQAVMWANASIARNEPAK